MSTAVFRRSFAGGEITPELFGNFDLTRNQTGVQLARNFKIAPHGVIENRAGYNFLNFVKDSSKATRIIPFNYNTEQTYYIELGDQYIRFHTLGATLLDTATITVTDITQDASGILTYSGTDPTDGDWLYLEDIVGMTELNGRFVIVSNVDAGANTFRIKDLFTDLIDTTGFGAYVSGGTGTHVYEVASPYVEADLFDIHFVQSADIMTLVHPSYAPRELSRASAVSWSLDSITFAPTIAAPTGVSVAATVGTGSITYDYRVTTIASDGLEESLQSSNDTVTNNLATAGNKNTVSWSAVTGAVRYNIYRKDDGIYGFIGQSAATTFVDQNITPDLSITPPINQTPFGSTDNYPAAVSYGEQRRVFAGTNNRRQTTWMTRSGTESNLSYSIPTRDDDSITFRIAARENNAIRHYIPLGDLLALTSSAAWRISSGDNTILSPSTVTAKPQAYVGASNVQPVVTASAILYVQAKGSHIQEIVYSGDSNSSQNGYKVSDISIMAPHLLDGSTTVVDMAYAHAPDKTAWVVRSDGILLGVTYVPEHELVAWHQHQTDGLFESAAVTENENQDELAVVVKRTINGHTVRFIETLHTRVFETLSDAFFVDSGLTYDGAPADVITGLHHLEGETVSILADGAVQPQQVVTNGTVTLDVEASKVHIGLPYNSDLQLLPAALQAEAYGQGRQKNINEIFLRVYRSSGIFAGPSFDADDLVEVPPRDAEPYGSPPALKSEEIDLMMLPMWTDDAALCIRQSDPIPVSLVAITMSLEVGGG